VPWAKPGRAQPRQNTATKQKGIMPSFLGAISMKSSLQGYNNRSMGNSTSA
jgi:hypothetical protein